MFLLVRKTLFLTRLDNAIVILCLVRGNCGIKRRNEGCGKIVMWLTFQTHFTRTETQTWEITIVVEKWLHCACGVSVIYRFKEVIVLETTFISILTFNYDFFGNSGHECACSRALWCQDVQNYATAKWLSTIYSFFTCMFCNIRPWIVLQTITKMCTLLMCSEIRQKLCPV